MRQKKVDLLQNLMHHSDWNTHTQTAIHPRITGALCALFGLLSYAMLLLIIALVGWFLSFGSLARPKHHHHTTPSFAVVDT